MARPEPPPDPLYKGIPLSEWLCMAGMELHHLKLKKCGDEHQEIGVHPREAIRAIGTNALPMIASELRVRDSKLEMWLHDRMVKRGWDDRMPNPAWLRHFCALRACDWLGDKALPAVPVIAELLSENVPTSTRGMAVTYLERLGPEASAAIPALEAAVQSKALVLYKKNGGNYDYAAKALLAIRGEKIATTNSASSREPTP